MNCKKLVIFDWDDTFTQGATLGYKACYHAVVEELGLNIDADEEHSRIIAKWGSTQVEEIRSLTAGFEVDQTVANKIYENHLFGKTFVDHLELVSGAKELIDVLCKSYTLAIATGLNGELLKNVIMPRFEIDSFNFRRIFSVYDLDDHTKAKPHPHMLETIMSELGFTPSQTIMVGDAKNDVIMAKAAGVDAVVVLTGHLDEYQAKELGVQYVIGDVTKLPLLMNDINKTLVG